MFPGVDMVTFGNSDVLGTVCISSESFINFPTNCKLYLPKTLLSRYFSDSTFLTFVQIST